MVHVAPRAAAPLAGCGHRGGLRGAAGQLPGAGELRRQLAAAYHVVVLGTSRRHRVCRTRGLSVGSTRAMIEVCVVTYRNEDSIAALVRSVALVPGSRVRIRDNSPDEATLE